MLGLLDQRDQRRRVAGDADNLQFGPGQMQFGDIGMIGQQLAQRLEHDDAGRRLIFAPLQRCDRRAVAAVGAGADRGPARRDLPRQLALLRAKAVADIGRHHKRKQRHHRDDAQHDRQRAAQPCRVEMPARLLFKHFYAPGIAFADIGADGDGRRMEHRYRLHITHRDLARGRRDHRGDALGAAGDRRAAAKHRFAGAPRRQPVDLRAHDAFQKVRRARRQLQRAQQEPLWLQHDLDPASPKCLGEIGRRQRAVGKADARGDIVRPRRAFDREATIVLLDQPDHARRHRAVERGDNSRGDARRPCTDDRADRLQKLHREAALCGAVAPSETLRQDNTR